MMQPGGGKRKGGSFERDVCRALSLWITNGERKDVFWRSAMSGGRSTVQEGVRQCGDICAVAPEGHVLTDRFLLECKHVRKLDLWGALDGRGNIQKFWMRAVADANRFNKRPILIAKQNNAPIIFCVVVGTLGSITDRFEPMAIFPALGMEIYPFTRILAGRFLAG